MLLIKFGKSVQVLLLQKDLEERCAFSICLQCHFTKFAKILPLIKFGKSVQVLLLRQDLATQEQNRFRFVHLSKVQMDSFLQCRVVHNQTEMKGLSGKLTEQKSLQCYKLVQVFMVTCLFTSQYNTQGYGTITNVIKLLIGSASCGLDQGITHPTIFSLASWFLRQPQPIFHCSILAPSYGDQTSRHIQ